MIIGSIIAVLFVFYLIGSGGERQYAGRPSVRSMLASRRAARYVRRHHSRTSSGGRGVQSRIARSIILRKIF